MRIPQLLRVAVAALVAATGLLMASPAHAAAAVEPSQPQVTYTSTTSSAAEKHGLRLTVDSSTGGWRVEQAREPGHVGVFYPVSYCYGNFINPRLINPTTLDFGGSQTCDNVRDWPHRIVVELQSTCPDIWCVVFQDEGSVDSGWRNSRVANAYGGLGCDNSDRRKYRLVTDVYARGVYIGAVVGSTEPILTCSM